MGNIPTIIKDAKAALEKIKETAEYQVLNKAVEELESSFKKRAYGFSLNALYTIATFLSEKKISPEDLKSELERLDMIEEKVHELFKNKITINTGRMTGKAHFFDTLNEIKELCEKYQKGAS